MKTAALAVFLALAALAAERERARCVAVRPGASRVEVDVADGGGDDAPWVETAAAPGGPWAVPEQEASRTGGVWRVTVRRPGDNGFFRAWRGRQPAAAGEAGETEGKVRGAYGDGSER
jgi:hypothetical protein